MNDHDRDPFDGPTPAGPLGEAMSRLTDDAPDADFTAWSIRARHENSRSARRQIIGGLAAGVAAIGVLVLVFTTLGRNGSDTATSASGAVSSSSAGLLSSSAAASFSSASSASSAAAGAEDAPSAPAPAAVPGSSSEASSAAGSTPPEAGDGEATGSAPDGGAAPPAGGGEPATAPSTADGSAPVGSPACATVPLTAAQAGALTASIPGVVPVETCAGDDAELGVQGYAVAGGTLLVEVRAGGFDPCAATGSADCADVADHPGVRTRIPPADGRTQVWISGRAGSVVLTATPDGLLPVDLLASAAQAVADAS